MSMFAISGLICGVSCIVLAGITKFFGRTKIHQVLGLFNLSVAIWGFGSFMAGIASTEESAIYGWRVAQVGGTFIAVFFYHIVCIFCELKRKVPLTIIYIWGLFFLPFTVYTNILFDKTRFIYDVHYNDATPLYAFLVVSWLFIVCLSFFEVVRYLPKTKGIKRTQTIYIITGFLVGFLGGASTLIPMFGVNLPPLGNFTIPIYCLISTYAILRYRLMDINLVLRKSMVYSLSAGILTSLFVVIIITMTKFFSDLAGVRSYTILAIASLIIAILFNPLRNKIQRLVDKRFYKRSYDYYSTIQQVSSTLATMFNRNSILKFIGNLLYEV
ncbi:MAG TPA: hypothetical protein ENH04_00870, partial [Nitrospirae bacterium]|nr:hypothetical protein [Nitrospirota bacterium]